MKTSPPSYVLKHHLPDYRIETILGDTECNSMEQIFEVIGEESVQVTNCEANAEIVEFEAG